MKRFITRMWARLTDTPRYIFVGRGPYARTAGVNITPDSAMTISTVFRCAQYITGVISRLPISVWVPEPGKSGGYTRLKELPDHPVSRLLTVAVNDEMGAVAFKEVMLYTALMWGNAYAEITRDSAGRVNGLYYIASERVTARRDENGFLYYEVSNYSEPASILTPEWMFHLHGIGYDGILGYSVVAYGARTMGIGMAAEDYSRDFFANDTMPATTFTAKGNMNRDTRKELTSELEERFSGSGKKHRMAILIDDMRMDRLTMPNDDAQLLQTRQYSVEEVCRWFGVPPTKVFGTQTKDMDLGDQNRDVINDTIVPWIARFEQEVDIKLLSSRRGGMQARASIRELYRGDPKAMGEYYERLFKVAAIKPDEIRVDAGFDPVGTPEADQLYIQGNNYVPLNRVNELSTLQPGTGEPPKPTEPPKPESVAAVLRERLIVLEGRTVDTLVDEVTAVLSDPKLLQQGDVE